MTAFTPARTMFNTYNNIYRTRLRSRNYCNVIHFVTIYTTSRLLYPPAPRTTAYLQPHKNHTPATTTNPLSNKIARSHTDTTSPDFLDLYLSTQPTILSPSPYTHIHLIILQPHLTHNRKPNRSPRISLP